MSQRRPGVSYALYTASANLWAILFPAYPPVSTTGATALTSGNQVIEGFQLAPDDKSLAYYDRRQNRAYVSHRAPDGKWLPTTPREGHRSG